MLRKIVILIMLILGSTVYAQQNIAKWEIVNLIDKFGDETEEKRLVLQTTCTFSNSVTTNSYLDVIIFVDNPYSVSVNVYEYGKYKVSLDEGIFAYKIGKKVIDYVPIDGDFDFSLMTSTMHDENTSLIYLLKQNELIKVSAYGDGTSYRFNIPTEDFVYKLSKVFEGKNAYKEFAFEVNDINNIKMEVDFKINYNWSYEKEIILKNISDLKVLVTDYFKDKNKYFAFDRPGGYYQKEKVDKGWGEPLLEKIQQMFSDSTIQFVSFTAW